MTRNKSLFLVIIFFLIVIVFSNIFWRMSTQGDNEDFDKIKQAKEKNLVQKSATTSPTSNSANAKANVADTSTPPATPPATPLTNKSPNTEISEEGNDVPIDPTSRMSAEETLDWKVYTNEKFEFKYPLSAQVVLNGDLMRVSQDEKTWKFRIFSNQDKEDLQTWYNTEFSEKDRVNCVFSESTLKVAIYETKYVNPKMGEASCDKAGYFAISSDKKWIIRVELGEETLANVNKILATFKFKEG